VARGARFDDLTFGGTMKTMPSLLVISAVAIAGNAAAQTYDLDPVHTMTIFSVEHQGLSNIFGRFDKTTGKVSIDRAAKSGSVDVAIDSASVNTNDADKGSRARSRDEHLRSGDFLNVAEFPRMMYKSTKVNFNGDAPASVDGNLTLLGTTKPVTLTVERFRCNAAQGTRKERCGGNVTGKFKRSDFGMKYGIPSVGDEMTIWISFEGDKE
jgi:polyisoprenoid-binding protein YceI